MNDGDVTALASTRAFRWRLTWWGLQLKLIALWGLLACSVAGVFMVAWKLEIGLTVFLAAMSAAFIDLVGRCLCLAAPIRERVPILGSVIFQIAGAMTLIAFALQMGWNGVYVGLFCAGLCQVLAAYLFTLFAKDMALHIHSERGEQQAERLQKSLFGSLIAVGEAFKMTTILSAIVLAFTLFTCGAGIYLAFPASMAIIPWALWVIIMLITMFRDYGNALSTLRSDIYMLMQEATKTNTGLDEEAL